jgi:catechol 2,3-dioxygenase-like lactoylglutathione lyase family enzyme
MPSPLNYTGGLTISMAVKDRKASTKWYTDVLGFQLLYDVAEIGWCELATEIKGVNIGLSDTKGSKTGAGPVPTFGVKDIDKARAMMEGKKVRFDGPTHEFPGMVKLATFFDPDGNALMLFQDLQGGH